MTERAGLLRTSGGTEVGPVELFSVALVPLAVVASNLVLMATATLVFVGLVLWDLRTERSITWI